jgi:TfoX/Sxy family transcriptional regulator of competence genes
MSTRLEFIEFICDQIADCGAIRYRKMFGEFMVYVNDKPLLLVCDNTVYVKMHPVLEETMQNTERGFPYKGSKEHSSGY